MAISLGVKLSCRGAITSGLLAAILATSLARAQGTGSVVGTYDYYAAAASPQTLQTLKNVESFHIEPGRDRMKKRNYPGALQDFEFILNYFPNHPIALALVSDLCDLNWKSPQCDPEPYFERAFQINPKAAQTWAVYGLHLQRIKSNDKAIDAYKRSLALNPASMNAHYNLGLAYVDLKRFDLANQHAQAAYALGYPLPGLKDKLVRAGQWKDLPRDAVDRLIAPAEGTERP